MWECVWGCAAGSGQHHHPALLQGLTLIMENVFTDLLGPTAALQKALRISLAEM